jgi:hypothetical protein
VDSVSPHPEKLKKELVPTFADRGCRVVSGTDSQRLPVSCGDFFAGNHNACQFFVWLYFRPLKRVRYAHPKRRALCQVPTVTIQKAVSTSHPTV